MALPLRRVALLHLRGQIDLTGDELLEEVPVAGDLGELRELLLHQVLAAEHLAQARFLVGGHVGELHHADLHVGEVGELLV
ncbi:MAG: hypothetical protein ACYTGK_02600, partial [Planctomycetota bacterium]